MHIACGVFPQILRARESGRDWPRVAPFGESTESDWDCLKIAGRVVCKVLELWAGQAPLPRVVPAQAAERYLVSVTAIPVEFQSWSSVTSGPRQPRRASSAQAWTVRVTGQGRPARLAVHNFTSVSVSFSGLTSEIISCTRGLRCFQCPVDLEDKKTWQPSRLSWVVARDHFSTYCTIDHLNNSTVIFGLLSKNWK